MVIGATFFGSVRVLVSCGLVEVRTVALAWDETPVIPSRMMCTFWTDAAALTALT